MDLNELVGTPETRKNAAEFMSDYLSKLIRFIEQIYVGVLDDLKIKVPLTQQEVIKQARGGRRLIKARQRSSGQAIGMSYWGGLLVPRSSDSKPDPKEGLSN